MITRVSWTSGNESQGDGLLAVRFRADALVEATQYKQRRYRAWTATLPAATWELVVRMLTEAGFPRPFVSRGRSRVPTTIAWNDGDRLAAMTFPDDETVFLEAERIVFSVLDQIAPRVFSPLPWKAPPLIERAQEVPLHTPGFELGDTIKSARTEELRAVLAQQNPVERERAIVEIGKDRHLALHGQLVRLCFQRNPILRLAALRALVGWKLDSAFSLALDMSQKDLDPEVRDAARALWIEATSATLTPDELATALAPAVPHAPDILAFEFGGWSVRGRDISLLVFESSGAIRYTQYRANDRIDRRGTLLPGGWDLLRTTLVAGGFPGEQHPRTLSPGEPSGTIRLLVGTEHQVARVHQNEPTFTAFRRLANSVHRRLDDIDPIATELVEHIPEPLEHADDALNERVYGSMLAGLVIARNLGPVIEALGKLDRASAHRDGGTGFVLEAPNIELHAFPVHSRHEGGTHRITAYLRGPTLSRRGRALQIAGLLEEHDIPYELRFQTVRGELLQLLRHPLWLAE